MINKKLEKKINELEEELNSNTTAYKRALLNDLRNVENMSMADYLYLKKRVISEASEVPVDDIEVLLYDTKEFCQVTYKASDKSGKPLIKYVENTGFEGENLEERLQEERFVTCEIMGKTSRKPGIDYFKNKLIQRAIAARWDDAEKGLPIRSWADACDKQPQNQTQKPAKIIMAPVTSFLSDEENQ